MAFSFFGGIHPKENKFYAEAQHVQDFPEPDLLVVPMSQHIGAPCLPLVKKGDRVLVGHRSVTIKGCVCLFTPPCPVPSRPWKSGPTPAAPWS